MRTRTLIAAFAAAAVLAGCAEKGDEATALHGAPSPSPQAEGLLPPVATPTPAGTGGVGTQRRVPGSTGSPGSPGSPGASESTSAAPEGGTTWTPGPVLGGAKEAPPAEYGGTGDDFDRSAHLPPGAVLVIAGRTSRAQWRLYAYREGGASCVYFFSRSDAAASGGKSCQKPPLDPSVNRSENGRFGLGSTSRDIAHVRFEHSGGGSETFATVAPDGYAERFYAGEIAATPLTRVVGFDASGRVVSERTDMTNHNV